MSSRASQRLLAGLAASPDVPAHVQQWLFTDPEVPVPVKAALAANEAVSCPTIAEGSRTAPKQQIRAGWIANPGRSTAELVAHCGGKLAHAERVAMGRAARTRPLLAEAVIAAADSTACLELLAGSELPFEVGVRAARAAAADPNIWLDRPVTKQLRLYGAIFANEAVSIAFAAQYAAYLYDLDRQDAMFAWLGTDRDLWDLYGDDFRSSAAMTGRFDYMWSMLPAKHWGRDRHPVPAEQVNVFRGHLERLRDADTTAELDAAFEALPPDLLHNHPSFGSTEARVALLLHPEYAHPLKYLMQGQSIRDYVRAMGMVMPLNPAAAVAAFIPGDPAGFGRYVEFRWGDDSRPVADTIAEMIRLGGKLWNRFSQAVSHNPQLREQIVERLPFHMLAAADGHLLFADTAAHLLAGELAGEDVGVWQTALSLIGDGVTIGDAVTAASAVGNRPTR